MDLKILLEWDERCGISLNSISDLSDVIENEFSKRQYGKSISQIWVGISCRDRVFKQRKRYKQDVLRLEYDILLNYRLIEAAVVEQKKIIIKQSIIETTEQVFSKYEFENFDKLSFLSDFKNTVGAIQW